MIWQAADRIADALLYEGYLLYPYRATAAKNRYRWQFGVVAPRSCGDANECGPWRMQTQCLFEAGPHAQLDIKIRFLQVEARVVERLACAPDQWELADAVSVDGRELTNWDEAQPREVILSGVSARETFTNRAYPFEVDGGRTIEIVRNAAGEVVARVVRESRPISGVVFVSVEQAPGGVRKLSVRIENVTACASGADVRRAEALRHSLVSTHTLLSVSDGAFLSLVEPPPHVAASAASCENLHAWPVLVGQAPHRNLMLSAPIILYDYPTVAPESPGDLFDATEIDEILTLRVLTLTDQERRQAAATDPRARRVVERAAALPAEALERLHGAVRQLGEVTQHASDQSAWEAFLNPADADVEATVGVNGRPVVPGSRVRLCPPPGRRADAMDMFLSGQTATVAAVYRDLEGQAHIAVTVDAGRAADLHESNGRYFYFRPDEVEVLAPDAGRAPSASAGAARVLVAGIGNIFLGDDGFGPAVIQRLASRVLPEWAKVEDFGIRGVHLAYELLGATPAYETTIIVDAVSRGGAPGTLYVLDPEIEAVAPTESLDAHTLSVESVLGFLKHIGGEPGRVLIVGCEIGSVAPEMGLSDPVTRAVDGAADLVASLIAEER